MQEIARKQSAQNHESRKHAASQMMKPVEYKSLREAWTRAPVKMRRGRHAACCFGVVTRMPGLGRSLPPGTLPVVFMPSFPVRPQPVMA